ncbi:uncharacterized protein L969DRAFT_44933 [Mixia osmundae IAM 14324]|uniref:MPN domain-containing protein n=1 Tax=Mixia osmundae (strain CBS 9802 / IAM 14324 / JCM 22182 / KY 12970) TaxID=764103 RepID=G7DY18_MIXOS|nr:uncharacterized protein L969DRAFT_44933 [Mixia osmundae IAM 14324]KEI41379.1 hypothetical protein L969DRAFT_44933 [Mixia osmundae IAM 14324]GAA95478.1 hypothetical protein E5Q_02132 [Mixia osmundae IAM 14324]
MTEAESSYVLHRRSYLRSFYHTAKWPHACCIGALTASQSSSEDIIDAIPLLHHWTGLTMALQSALAILDTHLSTLIPKQQLVGFYYANARLDDNAIPPVLEQAALHLAKRSQTPPLLLMLDAKQAAASQTGFITRAIGTSKAPTLKVAPELPAIALQGLKEAAHQTVHDYDEHLDDIGCRWLRWDEPDEATVAL